MNAAFKVDGVCIDEDHKKLLVSIGPTIMGVLSEWLISCPPVAVQKLQSEINDIDESISALHLRRERLQDKMRQAWRDVEDKRWRAVQAFGHQIKKAIPVMYGNQTAEEAGFEVFEPDEVNEVGNDD